MGSRSRGLPSDRPATSSSVLEARAPDEPVGSRVGKVAPVQAVEEAVNALGVAPAATAIAARADFQASATSDAGLSSVWPMVPRNPRSVSRVGRIVGEANGVAPG